MFGVSRKFARPVLFTVITVLVSAVVGTLVFSNLRPYVSAEYGLIDEMIRRGRKAEWSDKLVFLAIDQRSRDKGRFDPRVLVGNEPLQLMASDWPWKRIVYAHILRRLSEAGAAVVVFDLLLLGATPFDEEFSLALNQYAGRVVIGFNFNAPMLREGIIGQYELPSATLVPHTEPLDDRIGFVNFWPKWEWEGVIREAIYRVNPYEVYGYPGIEEEILDSLATRALEKAKLTDHLPKDTTAYYMRWAPSPGEEGALQIYSVSDLFDSDAWKRNFGGPEFFNGKIVVVGPDGNWLKDEIITPFGTMPGPLVHLNAMNAALTGEFLHMVSAKTILWMLCIAGAASLVLSLLIRSPIFRLATFLFVSAGFVSVCYWLFNQYGTVVLMVSPLLIFNGSGLICEICEIIIERIERLRTRRTLERYVSKNVVKDLLDNPATYFNKLGGVRMPVTLLFSDLRGFTTLTESTQDESELVSLLNEYFSEMVKHIFERGGTLDKFMGDAIMAVWGNIETKGPSEDTRAAVNAALDMIAGLKRLNAEWKIRNLPQLAMGVGINHGEVIVGNLGSQEKMDLTVIGDAVNLGSRLEGLTKEFGVDMLLGEDAATLVEDWFYLQKIANVQVKGKKKPIAIYTVRGLAEQLLDESMMNYLIAYADGLQLFEIGEFNSAINSFEAALSARPNDPPAAKHLLLCEKLQGSPKPEGWNGVFVMSKK
jgi:adenylate cyclase